jgi:hypothetical protein
LAVIATGGDAADLDQQHRPPRFYFFNPLVLLSQKAAGGGLENQIVEAIHEPVWGLRWAWLMTVDRGLRPMLTGL